MAELMGVLQQIAQNTMKAMKPTEKATGTVISAAPLSVQSDITMQPIPASALVLTDSVIERTVPVVGGAGGTVKVQEGLKAGDKVLMLRVQHGNQYIILSKITGG